ncbi:MAG: zinc ribbon domain-containing protein, partial [Clostridia bacterium]|nr:zinc ribbon domain-containing protein [Clostridia bacterium]
LTYDSLTEQDLKYLDGALENVNYDCAVVGGFLYGDKKSPYYDNEKAFYCYAVTEQYGLVKAHKKLKKNYAKLAKIIDENDGRILFNTLKTWAARLKSNYSAYCVKVVPASFSDVIDYKNAYSVTVRLEQHNGYQPGKETVYAAFVRGKDTDAYLEKLTDNLTEAFTIIADKKEIAQGEIYVKGERKFCRGDAKPMRPKKKDSVNILSDAEINVKVSDAESLERNVCPNCGAALDENGACPNCGKKRGETGEIEIKRAKEVEALICTQCGSPVQLDGNGTTAYCSACGTTFVINSGALSCDVGGINYKTLRADMPKGSELPDIKFVRARIAGGKITAVMPESFEVMSDEARRIKYPYNTPPYIYTTPDTTVNLNLNFRGELENKEVEAFGKQMLASLKSTFQTAKFGEAKLIESTHNIYFIDFITAAIDQPVYNTMFFFSLDGEQGIGNWNCLSKDRWYWSCLRYTSDAADDLTRVDIVR